MAIPIEIWRDVVDYEGHYQVSSTGRIKSLRRDVPFIMKQHVGTGGYAYLNFSVNCKRQKPMIHRLVAMAFIHNTENKREVNHKDGNKQNNNIANLEWMTPSENMQHSYDTGLNWHRGSKHKLSKLTDDDVRTIKVLLSIGEYQKTIAKAFGVSQQKISHINQGVSWSHINP